MIVSLVAWTGAGYAQSESFSRISEMPGVTSVYVSPKMFEMMNGAELGEEATSRLVSKMGMLLVLTAEKPEAVELLRKEMQKVNPSQGYEYLMKMKDGEDGVNILMKAGSERNNGKRLNEYVLLVDETDSYTVVIMEGSFTLDEVQQVMNAM